MGLEKVKERVLEEAGQKAKARIDSARAEAKEIAKSFSSQTREKEAALKSQLEAEAASIKRREAAAAKLESKKLLLSFRKEFIEGIFSLAREKLASLPESERASHVKNLLKKASAEIEVAIIYCNRKDARQLNSFKAKDADIIGGIIAESSDGSLRVDYSYETMLEQLKDTLLPELDRLIFAGTK